MVYLYGFVLLNLLTFLITAYDKQLAVAHKNRISENSLTFAAVGGTIGAALAMYLFRHKTSKLSFLNFTDRNPTIIA
jgi:uncharacterized membrane protein YsdA (DUF1294 family)